MPAKSPITNAEIKTSAYSAEGRKNHDRIFSKKSAIKWLKEEPHIRLLDNDGWRWSDGVTMESPISYSEFQERLQHCTICYISPEAKIKATLVE